MRMFSVILTFAAQLHIFGLCIAAYNANSVELNPLYMANFSP
jgi:hypothetical protein